MKSLIRCPHSGQASTKRLLSLIFGISSILLAFLYIFIDLSPTVSEKLPMIISGFVVMCGALQGITTNTPWAKPQKLNKDKNETEIKEDAPAG